MEPRSLHDEAVLHYWYVSVCIRHAPPQQQSARCIEAAVTSFCPISKGPREDPRSFFNPQGVYLGRNPPVPNQNRCWFDASVGKHLYNTVGLIAVDDVSWGVCPDTISLCNVHFVPGSEMLHPEPS